MKPNAVILVVS